MGPDIQKSPALGLMICCCLQGNSFQYHLKKQPVLNNLSEYQWGTLSNVEKNYVMEYYATIKNRLLGNNLQMNCKVKNKVHFYKISKKVRWAKYS